MADIPLEVGNAQFLGSAFPQLQKANGTNFPVAGLAYDATDDEAAFFVFRAEDYTSGNITIDIDWYAAATTNNVVWEARLAAITPGDAQSVLTDSLATLNFVQDAPSGTSNGIVRASITLSNLDSIADEDWCALRIARDADSTSATDNMSGDAIITFINLSYS